MDRRTAHISKEVSLNGKVIDEVFAEVTLEEALQIYERQVEEALAQGWKLQQYTVNGYYSTTTFHNGVQYTKSVSALSVSEGKTYYTELIPAVGFFRPPTAIPHFERFEVFEKLNVEGGELPPCGKGEGTSITHTQPISTSVETKVAPVQSEAQTKPKSVSQVDLSSLQSLKDSLVMRIK